MTTGFKLEYLSSSKIIEQKDSLNIFLSTPTKSLLTKENIFKGSISFPLLFRDLMFLLSDIVASSFYIRNLHKLLDPVITCDKNFMRMECFSTCGSVYGRVDYKPSFFGNIEYNEKGTTNINLNDEFIKSLASLRINNKLELEIGEKFVAIETEKSRAVEEKVKLPERWIKAFLQVQAIQRRAEPFMVLSAISAKQFITQLVKANMKDSCFLVKDKNSLQISSLKPKSGEFIEIEYLNRLKLLKRVVPHIKNLIIYQVKETGASFWISECTDSVITLGISSSAKNGFSGEGEALRSIGVNEDYYLLDFVSHLVKNLENFTISDLAQMAEISLEDATQTVDILSMNGILGFDVFNQSYFYRVLPFVDKLNQRLENSKKLLSNQNILLEEINKTENTLHVKGLVTGTTGKYQSEVFISNGYLEKASCSCKWFQDNKLKRGPCKHLLALRLFTEKQ